MTYRININVPPGDGWVQLPPGQPARSGLFSAARGKDKDLPGWAAATARELLGPQADPQLLDRYSDTLSGSAADARARGLLADLVCGLRPGASRPRPR